ncbi:MAG: hypothetical protein ACI9U2_001736 [Bradymonadia bacterium]|jgi:hypothetical protein
MHALAIAVDDVPEDPRPQLFFEALRPAASLAVAAGVPLDAARDVFIGAMLSAARARWPQLSLRSLGLGRTTRSIRGLEKRPDPTLAPRGTNVLRRAEEALNTPKTRRELGASLPIFDGFDSSQVALAALLRTGRAEAITQRRNEPTKYQRTSPRTQAPADTAKRLAEAETFLHAVGDALTDGRVQTQSVRATPAGLAAARADIEAFIRQGMARLEARADGDESAVEGRVYMGSCPA